MEKYYIYVKSQDQLLEVTPEIYYEYYRPIWRMRKALQKAKKCLCPQKWLWKCDGDCASCEHYAPGDEWSLDYEQSLLGDKREDTGVNIEEMVANKILLKQLLKRLGDICPEFLEFIKLKEKGLSEREIATKLKIPRKTLSYRIDKARKILVEEFLEEK